MAKLFANSGDPDQMPRSVASDLGLHCLAITLLWVSRGEVTVMSSQNIYFLWSPQKKLKTVHLQPEALSLTVWIKNQNTFEMSEMQGKKYRNLAALWEN